MAGTLSSADPLSSPKPLSAPDPFGGNLNFSAAGGNSSNIFGGGYATGSNPMVGPYPDRKLPSWIPTSGQNLAELQSQYANTGAAFNTSDYDKAAATMQGHVAATAMNAANNAATEYANRTRQAGGSAAGAGLIKAEGQVGAQKTIGDSKVEAAKYDIAQREAAAGHAAQIATSLGQLRQSYLQSLVSYTTSEDQTAADLYAKNRALDKTAGPSWFGMISSGQGIANNPGYAYNSYTGQNSTQGAGGNWTAHNWGG